MGHRGGTQQDVHYHYSVNSIENHASSVAKSQILQGQIGFACELHSGDKLANLHWGCAEADV
jgi:hypothetical protein